MNGETILSFTKSGIELIMGLATIGGFISVALRTALRLLGKKPFSAYSSSLRCFSLEFSFSLIYGLVISSFDWILLALVIWNGMLLIYTLRHVWRRSFF